MKQFIKKTVIISLALLLVSQVMPMAFSADTRGDLQLDAVYGTVLSDLELPESYSWDLVSPEQTTVGDVGENAFPVCFTSESGETTKGTVVINVFAAPIKDLQIETNGKLYYTGQEVKPTVICRFNGSVLEENKDYTLEYDNNIEIGQAKVIVKGIGNFTGSSQITFYIVKTDVKGIFLSEREVELPISGEIRLTATIRPSNATIQDVIWQTSDDSVATVSNDGTVKAIANGTAVITVESVDGGYQDSCEINVITHVEKIIIPVGSVNLNAGEAYVLKAIVFPYSVNDDSVMWISSDESVAVVDANGTVTAIADGTATITAVSNDGGYTDDCLITVTTPESIFSLLDHRIVMRSQDTRTLNTIVSVWNDSGDIQWVSSNEKCVRVDENGTIHSIKPGKAIITASTEDGACSDACTVYVYNTWWQCIIWLLLGCIWYFK